MADPTPARRRGLVLTAATWRYPTAAAPSLGPVDLWVEPGELVLLTGPTGCGKSTLLRLASGLAERHGQGEAGGEVVVDGRPPAALSPSERVSRIGFVAQDPRDQLLAGTIGDELAFAAGAAGQPLDLQALSATLRRVGLDLPLDRPVTALSGGQCQRLVVGAALSAGARLLLLDEPLSWLDPEGAQALVQVLRGLADAGVAVLLVEHRVATVLPRCDRVVLMEHGKILSDRLVRPRQLREPGGEPESGELDLAELDLAELDTAGMERLGIEGLDPGQGSTTLPRCTTPVIAAWRDLRWTWPGGQEVLSGVNLELRRGERVALLGLNGAGKSTLLARVTGRLGTREVPPGIRVVEVPQDPDLSLFCRTVRAEIAYGPKEHGLSGEALEARVQAAATALGVVALLDRAPQSLSRGQRLRVAVAAAVSLQPDVLVLDEPSAGQDRGQIERMFAGIPPEVAVLFASHDLRLAGSWAHRVVGLREGRLVELEEVRDIPNTVAAAAAAPEVPARERGLDETTRNELDPRVRLVLLLMAGVLAVVVERPLSLGLLCAASLGAVLWLRPGARRLGQGALGVAALVWSTALSQGLFYPEQPRVALLTLGELTLWREGVIYGLLQSLRFVTLTLAGLAVAVSTPPDRMFAALLSMKLPYALAFLAATGLRFVPVIAEEWLVVRAARANRGRPAWRRAPWGWLALELDLLAPVVARSLRRARVLAESLDTRGFDPASPPPLRRPLALGWRDRAVLGLALSLTGTAVLLRLLFVAYSTEMAYFPALRPVYAAVRAWL